MKTAPAKITYQNQPDGVKVVFRNGLPVMAMIPAPEQLKAEYPNVIAIQPIKKHDICDVLEMLFSGGVEVVDLR